MIFLLMFFLGADEVLVPSFYRTPVIGIAQNGQWLLSDYRGSGIFRIDKQGTVVQEINYGSGQGPGEFKQARFIFEFPKHDKLVVIGKHADTHVFQSSSGVFQGKVLEFFPYLSAGKWDDSHFLILWGKSLIDKNSEVGFFLFDLEGNQVESWEVPHPFPDKEYIYEETVGTIIDDTKNIYCGSMAKPELLIYQFKKKDHTVWKLKPPAGYIQPPEEKLSRSDMFNKTKLMAYFRRFTSIFNIFGIGKDYVVVVWRHANEQGFTYDMYRLSDRALLSANQAVEGTIYGVSDRHVISLLPEEEVPSEIGEFSKFKLYPLPSVD